MQGYGSHRILRFRPPETATLTWRNRSLQSIVRLNRLFVTPDLEGSTMSNFARVAVAAIIVALSGISSSSSAQARPFPLTRCGPDLAYLCRLHGSFDARPFHYNLAIYPGCIKTVPVQTAHGIERRPVIVCGAPERPTVWWW
jgi:hypothetical protein